MPKRTIVLCGALLILLAATALYAQDATGDLLGRINNLRASVGLSGYTINGALSSAAQSQAQWMAETGSVSHVRPDGSSPRSRASAAGYTSQWVSENIYMGSLASVDTAWTFWVNSAIHYAGLTSRNYTEVGIGVASTSTNGTAYVLVFGSPGGYIPPITISNNDNNGGGQGASAPPSFVVGLDEHGNIMHEVQQADTLGDILLLYGYTWEDLPYILEINGLTEADYRTLEIGSVLLIPPYDGTYTPEPNREAAALEAVSQEITATPDADMRVLPTITMTPSETPNELIPSPSPSQTMGRVATAQTVPDNVLLIGAASSPSPEVTATETPNEVIATAEPVTASPTLMQPEAGITAVAAVPTQDTREGIQIVRANQTSPWLIIGVVVQVGVLLVAVFEFIRRARR